MGNDHYGTDPWHAERICRSYFPTALDSALILPINNVEQPSFGNYSEKEIIVMDILPKQLKKQFDEVNDDTESESYKDAIFLVSVLKAISLAWKIDEKKLIYHEWLRKSIKVFVFIL